MLSKSLILHAPEIRHLLAQGRGLVVRPVGMVPTTDDTVCVRVGDDGREYIVAADAIGEWASGPLALQPGEERWVKECWQQLVMDSVSGEWVPVRGTRPGEYRNGTYLVYAADHSADCHWRSAVHMPREASRLTIRVIGSRVGRVREISTEDARAAGATDWPGFLIQWDARYGKRGADSARNPWVVLTEIEVTK
jgi:hypothetical protein